MKEKSVKRKIAKAAIHGGFAALVAVMFISMLAILAGAQAAPQANGAVSIANLKISPQPVIAGENITVEFQLFNSFSNELQNVNIYLESQSPLINVSPTQTFLISAMGTGLYGGSGYDIFSYQFHVPASLPAGEYVINVVATYEAQAGVQYPTLPAESVMPIYIYVYGVPNVQLSANTQTQITPGVPFSLSLDALNSGTDKASNVSVAMLENANFTPEGAYSFSLGSIGQGMQQEAVMQLVPSEHIAKGTHVIGFLVNYTSQTGQKFSRIEEVPINIEISKPSFIVSVVGANPQQLYAGQNQTLEVEIDNTGNGEARNVSVQFMSSNGIDVGSSANYFNLGNMMPGQGMQEELFVSASRYANSTQYYMPVLIKYKNANLAENYSQLEYIPINMEPSAIFNVTAEYGSLSPGDTDVPVTFTIRNTGNEVAQGALLSMQAIYPISTVIPNAYISSIAPGQSKNVTFYVSVDVKGDAGSYPVTLYEQWQQPNGAAQEQYSYSNNYYVNVSKSGGSGKAYETYAAAIIVILIAAYAFAKRRKKAPQKKQEAQQKKSARQ
ncbi:MAG: COG1361 S-layer family protein [Candidatus Micrarchaeia archaeon]